MSPISRTSTTGANKPYRRHSQSPGCVDWIDNATNETGFVMNVQQMAVHSFKLQRLTRNNTGSVSNTDNNVALANTHAYG
jgi:hypothetical protein